jgi:thioesterase domain-containing protein
MSGDQDALKKLFSRVVSLEGPIVKLSKKAVGDPFVFFPSLPGGQGDGIHLAQHLDVPFWFMDVRGRFLKANPFPPLSDIAKDCADLIREKFGKSPVIVGGYCAGAILAMDAAKHLADAECDVRRLIVLDAAPFNTEFESNDPFSRTSRRIRQAVGRILKDPSPENIGEIAQRAKTIINRRIKSAFPRGAFSSHEAPLLQMSAEDLVPNFDQYIRADKGYMRNLWESILAYRPPVLKHIPTTVYLVDEPGGRDLAAIWRGLNPNADIRIFSGSHSTMHMQTSLAEAVRALLAEETLPSARAVKRESPRPMSEAREALHL